MSLVLAFTPFLLLGLFVTGIVLLTLGIRGKPFLNSPRCSKCDYDLRTLPFLSDYSAVCPECGQSLSSTNAVSFGGYRRLRPLILTGAALIVLPFLLGPLIALLENRSRPTPVFTGPTASAAMTNAQLIANLPKTITTPWDWQELENRQSTGKLSPAEVDQTIAAIIQTLNAQRAAGQPQQPFSWGEPFITAALASGLSPARTAEFFQAFYDSPLRLSLRTTVHQNSPLSIQLHAESPWNLNNTQLVTCLGTITLDGTPVTPLNPDYRQKRTTTRAASNPDQFSGTRYVNLDFSIPQSLPPGKHDLALSLDMGAIDQSATLRGLDGKPGTPDKWPSPHAHWKSTTRQSITILPKDQPLITLISDPNLNPFKSCTLHATNAIIRPTSHGSELLLNWTLTGESPVPLCYRVTLHAGTQSFPFGYLVINSHQPFTTSDSTTLPSLPADIHSIDLILTPDPSSAESYSQITQIWNQPLTLPNLPLARYDLK